MSNNAIAEIEKIRSTLENLKPQADAYYTFAVYTHDWDKAKEMSRIKDEIEQLLEEVDKVLSHYYSVENQLQEKLEELQNNDIIRLAEEFQI